MSTSPDLNLIQLIAADLGVDASFIEKDWLSMRIIASLLTVKNSLLQLVFGGGTSLSKGFGLIQRFSEDLDFKVVLPETGFNRNECRKYRTQLIEAIRKGSTDWSLDEQDIKSRNQGRFFMCQITYQPNFTPFVALRPQIKLEITFKSPVLPVENKSLQSFIAIAQQQEPEVPTIYCVSPVETAADKLSALTWRILSKHNSNEQKEPTLIRHLHDLAALENSITVNEEFSNLVVKVLEEDESRSKNSALLGVQPLERLLMMLRCLEENSIYAEQYERFVTGMSYATEDERLSFNQALLSVRRIINQMNNPV